MKSDVRSMGEGEEKVHVHTVHVYTYQVEPFDGFDKSGPADSADYAGTDFLVQGSQGHLPSGRIHTFICTCTLYIQRCQTSIVLYFHFRLCLSMSPHVRTCIYLQRCLGDHSMSEVRVGRNISCK